MRMKLFSTLTGIRAVYVQISLKQLMKIVHCVQMCQAALTLRASVESDRGGTVHL